jgi:hypothetical protein
MQMIFGVQNRRIASRGMLLNKFSPITGTASPNRVGVADGGKNQHGRAARGGIGGGATLPDGHDNDSAFTNDVVVPWCREQKLEVTRSRAYKKNDQAFVEQKNGAVVRRLMGYGRFDGAETARVMARLYAAARLYINFFQPSFKLKEKRREGAKVIKLSCSINAL